MLMEHNWPGNVRELENVVERAVVLAAEPSVPVDVLPDALLQANGIRVQSAVTGRLCRQTPHCSKSSTITSGG